MAIPDRQVLIPIYRTQGAFLECTAPFAAMKAGIGSGKALALDTPIATPSGWTTIGSLSVGDRVFDEAGYACHVEALSEIWPDRRCYRLVFDDGEEIVASAEHEWPVVSARTRKSLGRRCGGPNSVPVHEPAIVTTDNIARTLTDCRQSNHMILLASALQCPAIDLPIPPYTFGAWLGDGHSTQGAITCADTEILDWIRADGFLVVERPSQKRAGCSAYRITVPGLTKGHHRGPRDETKSRFWEALHDEYKTLSAAGQTTVRGFCRTKGVSEGLFYAWRRIFLRWSRTQPHRHFAAILRDLGVSGNKHIPDIYLRASESQRRALLAGLMDTDGTVCARSGRCELTSVKRRLADGFLELCKSLGYKATMREGVATLRGRPISKKYRVCFRGSGPIFRVTRKQERIKPLEKRLRGRFIVSATLVPSVPVRCIQVDSPSHLFLAGRSLVPTHNSFALCYDTFLRAYRRPGLYVIAAPTYPLLRDTTIRSFMDVCQRVGVRSEFVKSEHLARIPNGSEVIFRSTENPDRLRGSNVSGVGLDEASLMAEAAYTIAIGRLRQGGEMGVLRAAFTPKGKAHWTYDVFGTGRPDTELFSARTRDNPFLPTTFEETIRRQYGEGALAAQELEGEWVDDDAVSQVIPTAWVTAAQQRWTADDPRPWEPLDAIGVDPARGGKDRTCLAPRKGGWYAPIVTKPGSATPDSNAVLSDILTVLSAAGRPADREAALNIDVLGIGAAVVDTCRAAGLNANPVNFGAAPLGRDRSGTIEFKNLRAYAYWSFREALNPESGDNVALPPDYELAAELTAPQYEQQGRRLLVEPKDLIAKRLRRSPDKADAVVMAYLPVSVYDDVPGASGGRGR